VAIHLRGASTETSRLADLAGVLAAIQSETGGWLVISDRVDVALATGARGVQLRRGSLSPAHARSLGPQLRIGASVHGVDEASRFGAAAPDWLIVGNVFETRTHPGRPARGVALIESAARSRIPVIAIGGVRPEHVPALRAAGAWGVAAISGVWGARDPVDAVQLYLSSYAVC
jgi:thiazole tautomerase (transcriptional regulator TenI)